MSEPDDAEETIGNVELTFEHVFFSEPSDAVDADSGESRHASSGNYAVAIQSAIDPLWSDKVPSLATVLTPRAPKFGKVDKEGEEEVSVIYCDATSTIYGGGQIERKSMFCIKEANQCFTAFYKRIKIFSTKIEDSHDLYVQGSSQHAKQVSSGLFLPSSLASEDQLRRYPTIIKVKEE